MKRSGVLLVATLSSGLSFAQTATLTGVISDAATKEALIGASVEAESGAGTTADVDGRYTLILAAGRHVITVTSIGHAPKNAEVDLVPGGARVLDLALEGTSTQLDMVVVSAGKFQQRVGEITQSLSVLRPELIRNKNVNSLGDAMDQVPGVVVVDDDPQIRSGSGFSYGAGSRVMVLVDDLPILSGDIGRPNWTFLPIENLEQVEVIKGASSVLYGSAALSGVINVRTAYPRKEPRTRVTVFGGVYDTPGHAPAKWWDQNPPLTTGANFFHSQQFGPFDLVLGGAAFSDAGYVGPERIDPDTLASDPDRVGPGGYENRIRFNMGTRWRNRKVRGLNYGVNFNGMKSRSTSVFIWDDLNEGFLRPEPGTVTRTLGGQYYIDPFVEYTTEGGTKHSLRGRYYQQRFDNDNAQSNANHFLYGEYQIQRKLNFLGSTMITAGITGQKTTGAAELYSGNPEGTGANTAMNAAGYLQIDKKLFREKLNLSAGVRYESFRVNEDEQAKPVLRAGANYHLFEATYLRASYGQGFRFPTIGERFILTNVGKLHIFPNPDLKPEESWNVEGGIKQGFKIGGFMGYIDLVAFQQEFSNYIEFTFGQWGDPADLQNLLGLGFKSVNTGGARVRGMEGEIAGKGSIGKFGITVLAGYTTTMPVSTTPDQVYATPTYSTSQWEPSTYANTSYDTTDNILKFRVQNLFRSDVQVEYKRFFVGSSVRYNSHVRNIDKAFITLDAPNFLPDGAKEWMETHTTGDWIFDARAGFDLSDQARVSFIVNNITNLVYAIRPLSAEAPRNFQVQLTWTL